MAKRRRTDDDVPQSSRRKFLGQASCAAVGTTALFNTVLNLRMFNALAAPGEDYRALVCLFFGGGIDSFNVVVPTRRRLVPGVRGRPRRPRAAARDVLLPIVPRTPDGRTYGLHPGLVELQPLFAANQLGIVSNVGTLVEPTTLDQYRSGHASRSRSDCSRTPTSRCSGNRPFPTRARPWAGPGGSPT